jgi:hypothetical protein
MSSRKGDLLYIVEPKLQAAVLGLHHASLHLEQLSKFIQYNVPYWCEVTKMVVM